MNEPLMNRSQVVTRFAEPVLESQRLFRTFLRVMAEPGRLQSFSLPTIPVSPLSPATVAICLTLLDYETPIWVQPLLRNLQVMDFLRLYCGCPITEDPRRARFALIGDPQTMPAFSAFNTDESEYLDRSTTLIIQVLALEEAGGPQLSGPGAATGGLLVTGVERNFWNQWHVNRRLSPGVDIVFAATDRIAALPRTTRVERPVCI